MQGHAGSNLVPVVCSNSIGMANEITFYGGSLIPDHTWDLVEHFSNRDDANGMQMNHAGSWRTPSTSTTIARRQTIVIPSCTDQP